MKRILSLVIGLALFGAPAFGAITTLTATAVTSTPAAIGNTGNTGAVVLNNSNTEQVLNPQGDVFFVFNNTDGTNACTITLAPPVASVNVRGYGTLTTSTITVSTTTKTTYIVGPFPALAWNASGYVQMTSSGTGCAATYVNALYVRPL